MKLMKNTILVAIFLFGCASNNANNIKQNFSMSSDGIRDLRRTDYSLIFNDLSNFISMNFETSNKIQIFGNEKYRSYMETALKEKNIYVCEQDFRCKHQLDLSVIPDYKEHSILIIAKYDGVSISRQYQKSQMAYKPVSPFSIMKNA